MNKITIRITEQDYYNSQWTCYKLGREFLFMTLITCFLGYFFYKKIGISYEDAIVGVLGYLSYYFSYYLSLRYKCKKIYKQQKVGIPVELTWNNDVLEYNSENFHAMVKWTDFAKFKENSNMFLLYQSDVMFSIIPKLSFKSKEQMDDFSSNLQAVRN